MCVVRACSERFLFENFPPNTLGNIKSIGVQKLTLFFYKNSFPFIYKTGTSRNFVHRCFYLGQGFSLEYFITKYKCDLIISYKILNCAYYILWDRLDRCVWAKYLSANSWAGLWSWWTSSRIWWPQKLNIAGISMLAKKSQKKV